MEDADIFWDLPDDPDGNVWHIAEHDLTPEEVESVLRNTGNKTDKSRTSGRRATFGVTTTGRHIVVMWDPILADPLTIYPVTAYEVPERRRRKR